MPDYLKQAVKNVLLYPLDLYELLTGKRDQLTPPKRICFGGDGDFKTIGSDFLNYFITLADLKPNHRVLDVGCGIGRMAVPLTAYLNNDGRYKGFDIVPRGIKWCQKAISTRFPNFEFKLADIYNNQYNPRGKYTASEYVFPYNNNSFDFVFLTSVFTHMLPNDMNNYLEEIARVLKEDGRCLITFFLINEESSAMIHEGRSQRTFKYDFGDFLSIDKEVPEYAIAYHEHVIRGIFAKNYLKITEPIHYGSWCGRNNYLSYQDIIIAARS